MQIMTIYLPIYVSQISVVFSTSVVEEATFGVNFYLCFNGAGGDVLIYTFSSYERSS